MYNYHVGASGGKEVKTLLIKCIMSVIISVAIGVISNYIYDWLNRHAGK